MVAAISGPGLGLTNTSPKNDGSAGVVGTPALGQGGENAYVNTATGNLVLQDTDELLAALGVDVALVRTYNSQGQFNGGAGENWRLGVQESLGALTGTLNTTGSTITKTFGDGATVVYTYDSAQGRYLSPAGAGADDSLTYDAASQQWSWVQGSTRLTETYDSSGRPLSARDTAGNTVTYGYTGSLLTQITDASGQTTYLDYSGSNITQIRTVSQGATQTLVHYAYDAQNRLTQVTVDLSPQDNSVADGNTYVTTYSYDGTSDRIASIIQSDGTSISFTYQNLDGQYRISSYTDGLGRVTQLTYTLGGTGAVTVNDNPGVLSSTQTQTQNNSAALNGAAVSTTQTQTSSTTYNLNTSATSTTQTTTTTTNYNLNSGALTTSAIGWSGPSVLPTQGTAVNTPKLGYDANGNGVAIWASGGNLFAQRYTKASNSWSGAVLLDSLTSVTFTPSLSVDSAGNALAAWVQSNGTVATLYASRFSAASGTWSAPSALESSTLAVSTAAGSVVTALNGTLATAAWLQTDGTVARLYVTRYNGSSWTAPVAVNAGNASASAQPSVAMDAAGNILLLWQQSNGTTNSIYVNRFSASSGAWGGATLLETSTTAANDPKIGFDANGNGFALWRAGGSLYTRHYTAATNTWSAQVTLSVRTTAVSAPSLSVDAAGDALAAWIQSNGTANVVYVSRFSAAGGTWSTTVPVETSTAALATATGNVVTALNGAYALVSWVQSDGPRNNLFAASFNGSTWSAAALIGSTNGSAASEPTVSIDAQGNSSVLWQQSTASLGLIYAQRYNDDGRAYYTVRSGDTWASIAQSLYGASAPATQLQSALGNPALTPGVQLRGWPPLESVTTTTTTTVSPYYTVQSGDTWASIAQLLYGSSSAASKLQSDLNNPALTAGAQLTNLPATETVTTTTTVTVPPYYTVQASDSWATITQALYGTSDPNAIAALQAALGHPTLTTGEQLSGLPATLTYTTTTTVTVPPYYTVLASDTWASITQTVYGTSDPNAVAALQAALGNPTLTAGLQLTVPATLTFGSALAIQTDITDPLGLVTTLQNDATGRLTDILSPAVSGTRLDTRFAYGADGKLAQVTQDPNGLDRATIYQYDSAGNLLLTRDASGDTLTRTYDSADQVLTETRYTVADPDGSGPQQPGGPLTTRYVYDTQEHLRFAISATGDVTEYRYDSAGERIAQLQYVGAMYDLSALTPTTALTAAQLTAWTGGQDLTQLQRTDYTYDFRGNLSRSSTYAATDATGAGIAAGASVRQWVYDQYGHLLQSIDPRGNGSSDPSAYSTTYTYDGLGRVLTQTAWISPGVTQTTLNQFDDAHNTTSTTLANGLVTTSVRDAAGELVSVDRSSVAGQQLGTTHYTYDADGRLRTVTDPDGVEQHLLYDDAGRKVATVDGNGNLTQYVYNAASQVIETIQYAGTVNVAALTDTGGAVTEVPLATLVSQANTNPTQNRIARQVYDSAGRLVFSIDDAGAVAQTFYDGASRATDVVEYATPVSIPAATGELTPAGVSVASSAADRHTRTFYDADGRVTGTLDAEGYLVEYRYDGAGQLAQQIAYATQTAASLRASGTLDALRPASDATHDIVSHFFYDGEGRRTAVLDAEGYLTETQYDVAGNVSQTLRYATRVTYTPGATLASLRPAVLGQTQITSYAYDGLGRVTQQTDFQGTVTQYQYDDVGNLISTTRAVSTPDARTTGVRYDALGRVIAQLTPQGSAQLTAGMTQAQIDAVWAQYGVSYAYDAAGHRVSMTDQNGLTTYYYYDADGRQRYVVNAAGDVTETRYDTSGRVTDTLAYATPISVSGLAGGLAAASDVATRVQSIANAALDSHTTTTYGFTAAGRVQTVSSAEGQTVTAQDDAFGDVITRSQSIDATHQLVHQYTHDHRGLLTLTQWDPSGIDTTQRAQYDAFGRVIQSTDANGNLSAMSYDRLGREVSTVDALGGTRGTTYDAFSRTLTTTDELGAVTTYAYDDATRTVTLTTPEGVSVATTDNRFGQTAQVTDGNGNATTYSYDANGDLIGTAGALGTLSAQSFDAAGRLLTRTDARGTLTAFSYDAANRVLTRTVDPTGLALTTQYAYDGEGRTILTTDANNVTTATQYDRDGRVASVTVDPTGLALTTQYSYDLRGDVLTVTQGAGSATPRVTRYVYDTLGRRTSETVDPGTGHLNLTTSYAYDGDGNVVAKTDPAGGVTRYVYDAANRLRYTVDALGGVTESDYDGAGRLTETRRYATAINVASLPTASTASLAQVAALLVTSAADRLQQSVYDADGRVAYTINAAGAVTQNDYDANGNVLRQRVYAQPIAAGTYASTAAVRAALAATTDVPAADREQRTVYDARNRAVFSLNGLGDITQSTYDGAGNLIQKTAYAATRATEDLPTAATMAQWVAANANPGADQTSRTWYDAGNRAVLALDAEGGATATQYDALGRVTDTTTYATAVSVAQGATLAQVQAAIVANAAQDEHSQYVFDNAGRTITKVDAAGYSEYYEYDALGDRTSYTNKAGATWTYDYDASGRMTFEHSPAVDVTTVSNTGNGLAANTAQGVSLTTALQYDALGNVTSRTEAYGTAKARTTSYEYDALGRQIRTNFAPLSVYNASSDDPTSTSVTRTEVTLQPYSEVTYDTLGDEVMNRDVSGNYSYRTYDALGRVKFEVDADRYVSEHRYDAFGNQTDLVRYANALTGTPAGAPLTSAGIQSALVPETNADRTLHTDYDRLNRAVTVVQPAAFSFEPSVGASGGQTFTAGATTANTYNALGELLKQSVLVNPLTSTYADTYFYYDRRGLKVATVDALGNLTTAQYDAFGNLTLQSQYAKPLAAGSWGLSGYGTPTATTPASSPNDPAGYDRVTQNTYDTLNRKTSQSLLNVQYSRVSGGTATSVVGNQTSTYSYDALGNETSVTDATGATSYLYYDTLGREIAAVAPARNSGNGILTPLTLMLHDAFGNLVEQVAAANSAVSATAAAYQAGYPDPVNDRTTLYLTDAYGHVIESQDPTRALRFSSYDVAGRVAKEWQPVTRAVAPASGPVRTDNLTQTADTLVTIHVYDALGQEVRTISPQTLAASAGVTTPTLIVQTDMTYDAFGEMTRKGVNGGAQEYYEYDQAGRLWRTNSGDGVAKVYLYNLAGRATGQIKSQQLDLSTYADAASVAALSSGVERTETRYDLNGNVLEQRLPYFTQSNPNAGLQQIGAQFQIDNNVLAPSNPTAIYRFYGGDGTLSKFAVADPGALAGNGGGYYYQAPTAANPAGGWVQDPTYHLVSGRYLHWAQPQSTSASATVSYLGTLTAGSSVTATFQYRPSGNPNGAWTTLAVVPLANAEFGINTGSLADGSYDYKVTYTRPGDVTPYAMATGTMTFAGATATTTDTTAATLAASGVTPVSISQALAVNGAFKDASFRIGDVSARGTDNYVYKKVVTGTLVDYEVDSSATVAAGGGYYLTASGYVQDPNYTPLTSRYVYWNQPSDSTLTATFEYRLANGQSAAWTPRAVTALGNGLWGAAIGDLPGGSYDYQILYSHSGNSTAAATATGTFNLDPVTVQNTLTLTTDPTDDAGFVAPLSNQPPNQISASIVSSATPQLDPNSSTPTFQPNNLANLSWDSVGTNQLQVKFPPVKGPVAVEIEYITQPYGEGTNPGVLSDASAYAAANWNPGVAEKLTLYFADASQADQGLNLIWQDPAGAGTGGQLVSGISSITAIRVYRQGNLGQQTSGTAQPGLLYATDANPPTSTLYWTAPTAPNVTATFEARELGTSTWTSLPLVISGPDYTVDASQLAHGTWEYQITYTRGGNTTAQATGTFSIGGDQQYTPARSLTDPTPAAIPAIQVMSSEPAVSYQLSSSAQPQYSGGLEYVDGFESQPGVAWSGTNTLNLNWPALASGPVKVDLTYVTAPYESFTETNTTTPRWQATGLAAGVTQTQSLQFASAPNGAALQWSDAAGGPGGVSAVTDIKIYKQVSGNWVLAYEHDGSQLPSGTGLVLTSPWTAPYGGVTDGNYVSQFQISPHGANSWTTLNSASGTVNLSAYGAGTYDYRLTYSLTNSQGKVLAALSQASGTLTIPTGTSTPITLTQSNVVFDQGPSAFAVQANGTQLSWSQAAASGDTVTVLSRAPGATSWTSQTLVTGSSPNFTVNLPSGVVQYEIQYTASGAGTPYLQAAGTLAEAVVTTSDSPSGAIGQIAGVDNPNVTAAILSSATSSGSPVQYGQGTSAGAITWNGTNQVQMSWANLGTAPVKVVLDYVSQTTTYGYPYSPSAQAWVSGNSLPGVSAQQTFNFATASTGATLSWSDALDSQIGGINHVQQAQVFTQDASGNWVLTYNWDGATSAVTANKRLYWAAPENLGSAGLQEIFKIKPQRTDVWQTLPVIAGTSPGVDLSAFATGNYNFELLYTNGGAVTDVAYGLVSINDSSVGGNIQVIQTNLQLFAPSDLGTITPNGSQISWIYPAASGDTVQVRYAAQGSSTWLTQDLSSLSPNFLADLSAAGSGPVQFQIEYLAAGATTPYLETTGLLNGALPLVQTAAPDIAVVQNNTVVSFAPLDVTQSGDLLTWTTALPAGDTLSAMFQLPDGSWQSFTPTADGSGFSVDPSTLPPGTYKYQIEYLASNQTSPAYYASGTLTTARTVSGGGLSLVDNTQFFLYSTVQTGPGFPDLTQTVDRWGEVVSASDALGNTTHYRYNQLGQLTDTQQPRVQVTSTAGGTVTTSLQSPETQNYYDILGRLIATRDANGNVNSVIYNEVGQEISESHPDGGTKSFSYDIFGDQLLMTNELGFQTLNSYDADGRLIESQREIVPGGLGDTWGLQYGGVYGNFYPFDVRTQFYTYDQAGRRTSDTDGNGLTTTYSYDLRGNLVERVSPIGQVSIHDLYYGGQFLSRTISSPAAITRDVYDTQGHKTQETDADGNISGWVYNYFGQLQSSTDLGGATNQDRYDNAGDLTSQTGSLGANLTYTYDEAGHLTQIADAGTPSAAAAGLAPSNRLTQYGYDLAGRRVLERTSVDGQIQQDSSLSYDALGRLTGAQDPAYLLNYQYDAAGNRTHISATYYDHTGYGAGALQTQDLWYTYDSANRVRVSQGVNTNGTVGISASQGVQLTYNAAGERASARTYGTQYGTSGATHTQTPGYTTEVYGYDGIGNLTSTTKDGLLTDQRTYDGAGQETDELSYTINPSDATRLDTHEIQTTYDAGGREQQQNTSLNGHTQSVVFYGQSTYVPAGYQTEFAPPTQAFFAASSTSSGSSIGVGGGTRRTIQVYTPAHWSNGYDAAGVLRAYQVKIYNQSGQYQYTSNYTVNYRLGSTYQQTEEDVKSTDAAYGVTLPESGSTQRSYDVNGFLVSSTDSRDPTKNRYFSDDASGNALMAVEGNFDGKSGDLTVAQAFGDALARTTGNNVKSQYFFFADNKSVGTFGQLADTNGNFTAKFDVNFTPVSPGYPAQVPASVVTQSGDTLRSLAARLYGDGNLWYLIAQDNGLTDSDAALTAGTQLRVPNEVVSLKNNAQSFKPFDPTLALGNSTPVQPIPPASSNGCGALGELLVAAIAIIVAVYTAGAAAPAIAGAFGTTVGAGTAASVAAGVTTGAISGALGSAVSQGVGIAIGEQSSFNWKGVASAALEGGIGGGITAATGGPGGKGLAGTLDVPAEAQASVNAAINASVGQGVDNVLGLQSGFNWAAVAASAVAAPIANAAAAKATQYAASQGASPFAQTLSRNLVSGLINQGTYAAFNDGRLNYAQIVTDAFGYAVGDSLVPTQSAPNANDLQPVLVTAQRLPVDTAAGASASAQLSPLTENLDTASLYQPNLDDLLADMSPPTLDGSHQVQSGDSLAKIARNYYGDERYAGLIAAANGLSIDYQSLSHLPVGTQLTLPDASTLSDAQLSAVLRSGGQIISGYQLTSDQLAARAQLAAQQAAPADSSPTIDFMAAQRQDLANSLGGQLNLLAPSQEQAAGESTLASSVIEKSNAINDLANQALTFAAKEVTISRGLAQGLSTEVLTGYTSAAELSEKALASVGNTGALKALGIGLKFNAAGTLVLGAADVVNDVYNAPDGQKAAAVAGAVVNTAVQTTAVTGASLAGGSVAGSLAAFGAGAAAGAVEGDVASGVATPLSLIAVPAGALVGGVAAVLIYNHYDVGNAVKGAVRSALSPIDDPNYDYYLLNGAGM